MLIVLLCCLHAGRSRIVSCDQLQRKDTGPSYCGPVYSGPEKIEKTNDHDAAYSYMQSSLGTQLIHHNTIHSKGRPLRSLSRGRRLDVRCLLAQNQYKSYVSQSLAPGVLCYTFSFAIHFHCTLTCLDYLRLVIYMKKVPTQKKVPFSLKKLPKL